MCVGLVFLFSSIAYVHITLFAHSSAYVSSEKEKTLTVFNPHVSSFCCHPPFKKREKWKTPTNNCNQTSESHQKISHVLIVKAPLGGKQKMQSSEERFRFQLMQLAPWKWPKPGFFWESLSMPSCLRKVLLLLLPPEFNMLHLKITQDKKKKHPRSKVPIFLGFKKCEVFGWGQSVRVRVEVVEIRKLSSSLNSSDDQGVLGESWRN